MKRSKGLLYALVVLLLTGAARLQAVLPEPLPIYQLLPRTGALVRATSGQFIFKKPAAAGNNYYIKQSSSDPTNTGGAGTLASPWVNACNAVSTHTFAGDDTIWLMAASNGGTSTWKVATNGFTLVCHPGGNGSTGAIGPANVVFPLEMAGTSGHPIRIKPYCNGGTCDTVVISGSTDATISWVSDGGGKYHTTSLNFGSASASPKIRVNPSNIAVDEGTRLIETCAGTVCGTGDLTAAGQYAYDCGDGTCSGTKTIYIWMPDSGDPATETVLISGQQGDAAPAPLAAFKKTDGYVTIDTTGGGGITVRDGYHCAYFDDNTASPTGSHDVTLKGVKFVGCGGSDYGPACARSGASTSRSTGFVRRLGGRGRGLLRRRSRLQPQLLRQPDFRQCAEEQRDQEHRHLLSGRRHRVHRRVQPRDGRHRQGLRQLSDPQ
jgi:hypothetical protein